ncbi:PKD domain-containing protein [Rubrolithibacter danxiaensis]|uniref:PKD domain-containing protein n=1 Tax=Rubrolithibacter danxiaensis TaxID=3390805 RepID=UPI003BF8A18A
MRNSFNILKLTLLSVSVFIFASCKKDKTESLPEVLFSLSVEGNQVTFKNETEGAASYKWEFGDGETSTEASPVHVYPGKGKYVATVYITTTGGTSTEGSTIVRISKTSPVKLNDNSLADWDNVTQNVVLSGAKETYFKKGKFDYDAESIYIYLEAASKKSNEDIFDFYLDTDNDETTGLNTGELPGGGYDVLLEGGVLAGWFDAYNHTGEGNGFTFNPTGVSEFYQLGTVKEENGLIKFEMKLNRSKISGLSTSTALKLGIIATKSDWSATLGVLPDSGTPAILLDLDE